MSIATVSNQNTLQKKIFFPELDSTVLLIAIPKNQTLTDLYQTTKQLIFTNIESSHELLCNYNVFLITESSIFDKKVLLTLYEALKYKNAYCIDDLLVDYVHASECYLVSAQITKKLYCQGSLKSNRNLICKKISNFKWIQQLLDPVCSSLWIFYRNCITHMFLMLKSKDTSYLDNMSGNYCICNLEEYRSKLEIQKFKILLVIHTKHIQQYYNFQSHLFQLLTHRKKNWLYSMDTDTNPRASCDHLLSSTSICSNLNFWKNLWNYHQIFFNSIPFTRKNFITQNNAISKKSVSEPPDWIKCTVSKIRRKLKGTLYDSTMSNDNNLVNKQNVNNSDSKSNDDTSQNNGMEVHKDLKKYWVKRYRLFSKFDEGIKLDYESWFSVTPEKIAIHIAKKCKSDIIIDAFCGAGGNSIQFANSCQQVLSIDIDLQKLLMARHNAKIYGVDNKIDFILGNFFCLAGDLVGDVVFLSPPWGGPKYVKKNVFDLKNIMEPYGGEKLLRTAQKISRNIAYYLPKNIDTSQLLRAAGTETRVEVEKNFLNDQVVALTAYYGDLVDKSV